MCFSQKHRMDGSFGSEGPSILQLHKWDPSQSQLNLSEFREALISPTRELLLLLSYQCEVMLLPVITGDSNDGNISGSDYVENPQASCSSTRCSELLTSPIRSDSKENIPCPSISLGDSDDAFSQDDYCSSGYPFISDVNSVAWGACGDNYNRHKNVSFRELLFVCGNHGVTVHAFCHPDDSSEMNRPALKGDFRQGKWVYWGPSALAQNVELQEPVNENDEIFQNILDGESANGTMEGLWKLNKEARVDTSSGFDASKRWLRSFFTKAETVKFEGNFWTKFPEKSSFPSSAKVVSFSIFDSSLHLLDFLSRGNSALHKEHIKERVLNLKSNLTASANSISSTQNLDSNILPNNLDVSLNSLYKCTRVFSSDSHDLVGFLLVLLDSASIRTSNESLRDTSNELLIVSKLYSWGMQWVSMVKLEESLGVGQLVEWTDFRFSDNLVICLNKSGLIYFYDAMSGEYVAQLDILDACGINRPSNMWESNNLSSAAEQLEQTNQFDCSSTYSSAKLFRRLIVASDTSLLAAIDEYGVIYVICAGDHVPNQYYASEKTLPHLQHSGFGKLVRWEVGGSDIGHQRLYSNLSESHNSAIAAKRDGKISNSFRSIMDYKIQGHNLNGEGDQLGSSFNGFSAHSHIPDKKFNYSTSQSYGMRRIFLPIKKFEEDDCICFSSLGITRLTRKHSVGEEKGAEVVHCDLLIGSSDSETSCLNSCYDTLPVKGRGNIFGGEALGCSFQGCFYLVTQCGLSVFLPSISVSSNFLPVETIGYRQPGAITGKDFQERNGLESKESKERCSPWKVEILDRVLLFEGPKEADRVCLENGWNLKNSRIRRLQMALDYMKFDELKEGKHSNQGGVISEREVTWRRQHENEGNA